MEQLPSLISDLALILITAGVVAIIFRWLKQPLVLGYIVAGFLVGPHMSITPTVSDAVSISTWSQIGVIFLMFSLGLEFSFKKILKMGGAPVIAACLVMLCMFGVGNAVGKLFGWERMDCMFLGGMLAMSSTTIIYKALDDLGLRQQKFAGEVLSVLVLEDILGILLMVILSALAVTRSVQGTALVGSLFQLLFFLILWFIVGVYLVPSFLRKASRWLNAETLLIVSIGLCFLLVVFADRVGYSSAFGAFMMGSILAETLEAERIERITTPVKDLFGAIFFVSVGMMVEPQILINYWLPILVLILAVILGQALLGSLSFLLSGQSLKVAMQCGFSLAQIGEFAFIIASLGVSLGVTSSFLYPVVVAVSIITTFFTPYMIRASIPACNALVRILPENLVGRLSRRGATEEGRARPKSNNGVYGLWKDYSITILSQVAVYSVLSLSAIFVALNSLLPVSRKLLTHWPGNFLCGVVLIAVLSPFLRAIVMRKYRTANAVKLRRISSVNRFLLRVLFAVRFVIAVGFIYYVLNYLSPFSWILHVVLALILLLAMIVSRRVMFVSIRLERTFVQNLRQREYRDDKDTPVYARKLRARDVHTAEVVVPTGTLWGGHTLAELNFGGSDGVIVASIQREHLRFNLPGADTMVFPGDRLTLIADDIRLQHFAERMESECVPDASETVAPILLRRFSLADYPNLVGVTIARSGIRQKFGCLVIGVETPRGEMDAATADRVLERTDTLWLVGDEDSLARFKRS